MAVAGLSPQKEIVWTPSLIKQLRGKRTQAEFGALLGVPKNTVWRWEAGRAAPDGEHARSLSKCAESEYFIENWKLAGSMTLLGDIEEASRQISARVKKGLARSARQLTG